LTVSIIWRTPLTSRRTAGATCAAWLRRGSVTTRTPGACNSACPLYVLVTLRADFYDRPLLYKGSYELLRHRIALVGPAEVQRAIVGPAERVGLRLEAGLVPTILADMAEQPGALPLLEYALTELFERRAAS
jgi:hypothetical protein